MINWAPGLSVMNSNPQVGEKRIQRIKEAGQRKRGMSLQDRLFRKVTKTEKCWEFNGKTRKGYGSIAVWVEGKLTLILAHRLSWMVHFGPIPENLCVCHHCDNPKCVRPDHLFIGTHQDNMSDMVSKGREIRPSLRKLSAEQVRGIREKWGKIPVRLICEEYRIGPTPARRIGLRETYKNVA